MGHADIKTTMIYLHYRPQHDAADRLGELFSASAAPKTFPQLAPSFPENGGDLSERS